MSWRNQHIQRRKLSMAYGTSIIIIVIVVAHENQSKKKIHSHSKIEGNLPCSNKDLDPFLGVDEVQFWWAIILDWLRRSNRTYTAQCIKLQPLARSVTVADFTHNYTTYQVAQLRSWDQMSMPMTRKKSVQLSIKLLSLWISEVAVTCANNSHTWASSIE